MVPGVGMRWPKKIQKLNKFIYLCASLLTVYKMPATPYAPHKHLNDIRTFSNPWSWVGAH